MRKILEDFLRTSSPEQLRAELAKGNRPFFQTLEDANLVCESSGSLPDSVPASVSFFVGVFAEADADWEAWDCVAVADAANQELALAA